jgi:FkbM family methyltransferase
MHLTPVGRVDKRGRIWKWPRHDEWTWPIVSQEVENVPRIVDVVRRAKGAAGTCIQAGGNCGLFPDAFSQHFRTVYTFEPDPYLFRFLAMNVLAKNVVKYQAGLGEFTGVGFEIDRKEGRANPGANRVDRSKPDGPLLMIAIDSLFDGIQVDLIQLDIEGYELNALKGAEATIDRCHPVICVELIGHGTHYGDSDDAVRSWLATRGYAMAEKIGADEVWTHASS